MSFPCIAGHGGGVEWSQMEKLSVLLTEANPGLPVAILRYRDIVAMLRCNCAAVCANWDDHAVPLTSGLRPLLWRLSGFIVFTGAKPGSEFGLVLPSRWNQ